MDTLTAEDIDALLRASTGKKTKERTGSYVIVRTALGTLEKQYCRTTTALVGGFTSPRRMTATRKSTWLGGKAIENPKYIRNIEVDVVAYFTG